MRRASDAFREDQRRKIEATVRDAEARTSCEIVPVVATSSGRYDRSEDVIGFWCAVVAAAILWCTLSRPMDQPGSWGSMPTSLGVLILIAGMVVSFIIGTYVTSRTGWLRRLTTPRRQMTDEVEARARTLFFDARVHHTEGATGLLIYVSLFEHMAVVLGDKTIMDKLGQPFLDGLCRQLTDGLRQDNPTEAICAVISSAGEQLAVPLPRDKDDVDELENTFVVID